MDGMTVVIMYDSAGRHEAAGRLPTLLIIHPPQSNKMGASTYWAAAKRSVSFCSIILTASTVIWEVVGVEGGWRGIGRWIIILFIGDTPGTQRSCCSLN